MKKKIIITSALVLSALISFFIIMVVIPEIKNEKIRTMQINNIDLTTLRDGSYQGDFAYGHYTYKVDVELKNHKIVSIAVEHGRTSKQAKAAEGVVDNVIKEQKIDVDVISGATTTSKAILKAVEKALGN